jgi:ketosteroid isomerase-like protein
MLDTLIADNETAKREIEEQLKVYAEALTGRDLERLAALLTDDFQWALADGTRLDKAGTVTAIKEYLDSVSGPLRMSIRIDTIESHDSRAVVRTCEIVSDSGIDPEALQGELYEDEWERTDRGWQIRYARCLGNAA